MTRYSFLPNVDGDEFPVLQRDCSGNTEAIDRGRLVLTTLLAPLDVQVAFVAVFTGEADDGEPLGCWDWSRDEPALRWHEDS